MVPSEQGDQSQEEQEDDVPLLEGFQWESLMDASAPSPSRKRSLSESSLPPALARSLLPPRASEPPAEKEEPRGAQEGARRAQPEPRPAEREPKPASPAPALQRCDSALGDSSSGAELCDGPATGKRRRAAKVGRAS